MSPMIGKASLQISLSQIQVLANVEISEWCQPSLAGPVLFDHPILVSTKQVLIEQVGFVDRDHHLATNARATCIGAAIWEVGMRFWDEVRRFESAFSDRGQIPTKFLTNFRK